MPEATQESGGEQEDDTTSTIESSLHPKHQQTLMDAYNKTDWLMGTLSENQFIEVPSHLRSIRNSLKSVLTEQELLEHLFVCTYCGLEVWESEKPRVTEKACPECDAWLEHANTRPTEGDSK